MNLYLISQTINDDYDSWDSAVVAAESAGAAREIHPDGKSYLSKEKWMGRYDDGEEYINPFSGWVMGGGIAYIKVQLIGTTELDKGVVLASFWRRLTQGNENE